jgi:hypothetical protein
MTKPLTLTEVNNQLQIMEYIATNTQQGLTPSDRIILRNLENQRKRLTRRYSNRSTSA